MKLNLETAVTSIRYDVDGVTYQRAVFSSFPDQIMICQISASQPGKINFTASMNRPAPVDISTEGNNKLIMSGVTGDCDSIQGAVQFQAHVEIKTDGGSVSASDIKPSSSAEANIFRIKFILPSRAKRDHAGSA